jgi:hypothetical protein
MAKKARIWCGAIAAFAACAGLIGYFAAVGLDRADKLASVIGAFVGLAGLGLALHAALSAPAKTSTDVQNEISGTVHGNTIQARDIKGGITLNDPP